MISNINEYMILLLLLLLLFFFFFFFFFFLLVGVVVVVVVVVVSLVSLVPLLLLLLLQFLYSWLGVVFTSCLVVATITNYYDSSAMKYETVLCLVFISCKFLQETATGDETEEQQQPIISKKKSKSYTYYCGLFLLC